MLSVLGQIHSVFFFFFFFTGNEVHLVVGTDTEYEKKEKNNHFGLKCKVIGYEWSEDTQQVKTVDTPNN